MTWPNPISSISWMQQKERLAYWLRKWNTLEEAYKRATNLYDHLYFLFLSISFFFAVDDMFLSFQAFRWHHSLGSFLGFQSLGDFRKMRMAVLCCWMMIISIICAMHRKKNPSFVTCYYCSDPSLAKKKLQPSSIIIYVM